MDIELSTNKRKYDEQIQVLKNKNGSLESIRKRLGFNQKQMGELLLVDPSAWSRWTKDGEANEKAPPYVYKALDWYLNSQLKSNLQLKKSNTPHENEVRPISNHESKAAVNYENKNTYSDYDQLLSDLEEKYSKERAELQDRLKTTEHLQAGWKIFLIINSLLLIYFLFNSYASN